MKYSLIEPKRSVGKEHQLFSNQDLFRLIGPLFVEQLLIMLVGIIDTMMVSYVGEAAVSGVSLVNQLNSVFLSIFLALAAGGAVVISQYIGHKDLAQACRSCSMLLVIVTLFSSGAMIVFLVFHRPILNLLYGSVTPEVMQACITYLLITALSFPALGIYNGCSAMLRSMNRTKITMIVSMIMNVLNVIGNYFGVFVLRMGVAGVAVPSLLSRIVAVILLLWFCSRKSQEVHFSFGQLTRWNFPLIKRIIHIAFPSAVENGLLDGLKVLLSAIVALFGTIQIAANGVAQNFWFLSALSSIVMGPVFITVIGQCAGAGDYKAADYYINKLTRITYIGCISWNTLILLLVPFALSLYSLSAETIDLIIWLCVIHNVFNMTVQPIGFVLSNALRASGDVRYPMFVSIFCSILRVLFAIILGIWFQMGVIGVVWAMVLDWFIRAWLIYIRLKSGKWKNFSVI